MEIISAAASLSQLTAYTFSTAWILERVFKELCQGPQRWKLEASNISELLQVVRRLEETHLDPTGGHRESKHILDILAGINDTGQKVLPLILQSKEQGWLDIYWKCFLRSSTILEHLGFLSSRVRILQFAIAEDTNYISRVTRINTSELVRTLKDTRMASPPIEKANYTLRSKVRGNGSTHIVNNGWGEMFERERSRFQNAGNLTISCDADGENTFTVANEFCKFGEVRHPNGRVLLTKVHEETQTSQMSQESRPRATNGDAEDPPFTMTVSINRPKTRWSQNILSDWVSLIQLGHRFEKCEMRGLCHFNEDVISENSMERV